MKLHTKHTNIERGGVKSESAFTIKTNALSFSILSSGLYTDPEMAIVRELSCNAYDAHVEANNQTTPFEIHLPNNLEPFLSIKDFGIGLSDEDIQGKMVPVMVENKNGEMVESTDGNNQTIVNRTGGLYTTYFDSTKTNSNDFIGALGLGSKSPFSYTSAFEVISRHGGKKRTYAIFLNEDGIPSVALMGEINTDEHTGLEVKITIKQEDFNKFKTKAATALKYFPIKPKILGALHFEFDKIPKQKIETKKWMLSANGYYNSSITAVQGNVAYRVDAEQIREHLDERLNEFIKHTNIVIFFDIGDLEVSANREEIRYDKQSVNNIVSRILTINTEFISEIENKINKINKKYWYACIELNEMATELFGRKDAICNFVDPEKVNNKNLKTYIENTGRIKYSQIVGYELLRYAINGYYTNAVKLKRSIVQHSFEPSGDTLIVFNDIKKGGLKRIGNYLQESSYNNIIVINMINEPLSKLDYDNNPIAYEGHAKEFKRLKKELGMPDIKNISEITSEPEKTPTSRELSFYKFVGLRTRTDSYYSSERMAWEKTDCKSEDGGLFIPLKYASTPSNINAMGYFSPINIDSATDKRDIIVFLISVYNERNNTAYSINDIYGLPVTTYKKVCKNDKWINLFKFGADIVPEYKDIIIFNDRKGKTPNVFGEKHFIEDGSIFNKSVKMLDNDSIFKKILMPFIQEQKKYTTKILSEIETIKNLHNVMVRKPIKADAFYETNAFNKYPMLALIDNLPYTSDLSTLFEYIKLIDRS